MNMRKNKKGFTLMELVVTTAIMGTLAALAVPSFIETQAKAKSTKSMSNISEIGSKLGQVYNELSGEFGEIKLNGETATTPGGIASSFSSVTTNVLILSEQVPAGGTANVKANRDWDDIFENPPLSPFGSNMYQYYISTAGEVTYNTDDLGNVTVSVTPWQIVIFDQESPPVNADSLGLGMEFSY